MADAEKIAFKRPRSILERLRINFAITRFTWKWLWNHHGENIHILFSAGEDYGETE